MIEWLKKEEPDLENIFKDDSSPARTFWKLVEQFIRYKVRTWKVDQERDEVPGDLSKDVELTI